MHISATNSLSIVLARDICIRVYVIPTLVWQQRALADAAKALGYVPFEPSRAATGDRAHSTTKCATLLGKYRRSPQ